MGSNPVRVLLVDDDMHNIARVSAMLRAQPAPGFRRDVAASLSEAQRVANQHTPDIVLLNLVGILPGGLPALALLQDMIEAPVIVIVVVPVLGSSLVLQKRER